MFLNNNYGVAMIWPLEKKTNLPRNLPFNNYRIYRYLAPDITSA